MTSPHRRFRSLARITAVSCASALSWGAVGCSSSSSTDTGGFDASSPDTGHANADGGAVDSSRVDAAKDVTVDVTVDAITSDVAVDAPAPVDALGKDGGSASHDGATEATTADAHPACSPTCTDGQSCDLAADCESGVCTAGKCAPPACSPTCSVGSACGSNSDCTSAECASGKCVTPFCSPTCADGVQCTGSADCGSGVCTGGVCAAPACSPSCGDNAACGANGDCGSNVCAAGACVAPTCAPSCTAGNKCGGAADCASGSCTNGACTAAVCAPTCADKNQCGANSDCGSGVCTAGKCAASACAPTCAVGTACGANADCASLQCVAGLCVDTSSCAALLAANPTLVSGTYQINPGGTGDAITVYCDMTTDGGGWTQVYDQDTTVAPGYDSRSDWLAGVNTDSPNQGQYSILNLLGSFQTGGMYEFLLAWPTSPEAGSVQWMQVENPLTAPETPTISNVTMIPTGQTGCGAFRGMALSTGSQPCAMTGDGGDPGCYWWAVGESSAYNGGIPSFSNGPQGGVGTPHTQLWVR